MGRSVVSAYGQEVVHRVKYLQQLVRHRSDDALSGLDLSLAQYVLLRELAAAPGIRSAELARRCFVTRQSLRDVIAALRERHLISDAAGATGRAGLLAITDEGERIRRAGAEVMAGLERRMLSGLDRASRRELTHALDRCIDNLDEAADTMPKSGSTPHRSRTSR